MTNVNRIDIQALKKYIEECHENYLKNRGDRKDPDSMISLADVKNNGRAIKYVKDNFLSTEENPNKDE